MSKPTAVTGCAKVSRRSSFSSAAFGPGASWAPPGDRTFSPLVGSSLFVDASVTPLKPEGVKVSAPRTTTRGALGVSGFGTLKVMPESVPPVMSVPGATASKSTTTGGESAAALKEATSFRRKPKDFSGSVVVWSGPAFATGALFGLMTVTVTSSLTLNSESAAVRRRTYAPPAANVAVVAALFGSVKVTEPGPLTFVHVTERALPGGRPSSLTTPSSAALSGSVTVLPGPALTEGAVLPGLTVIVTS